MVRPEPAPAVPLAVPEVEVRIAPWRLRGLHLERVVVMTLVSIVEINSEGEINEHFEGLEVIL